MKKLSKATQPVGRKPTLDIDPQLTARICTLLAEGVSIQTACNLSGISERAYHDWQRRGSDGEEPYAAFFDAASHARSSWKSRLLAKVGWHVERGDLKALLWLIEKSFPDEYGVKHEEQQRGANGLLPQTAPPPSVHVTILHDEASDKARKKFGRPPPDRLLTRTL